jgi:NADH-quinone oxidoreductase subunit J
MMTGYTIVFYLLAAMTLVTALLAVTSRQIFRSAIYLMATLLGIAGLYFWMRYEFVAAVQIVVYAGGIAVLIIFSIFLTQQAGEKLPPPASRRTLFAALAVLSGFILAMLQVMRFPFSGTREAPVDAGMSAIGKQMLSVEKGGYALPFEVVSILLLAAMIGCIVIALRAKPQELKTIKN